MPKPFTDSLFESIVGVDRVESRLGPTLELSPAQVISNHESNSVAAI